MTDPTAMPNFPPSSEEHPLRGRVLDALQDLKLGPDLAPNGDVKYSSNDQQLFARCLKGGQIDIMRTFGQWQIADTIPADLTTRLNACNDVTLGVSLVKAGISAGNLVLSVEQVLGGKENPKGKLQIATGLILQAVALWHRNAAAKVERYAKIERGENPDTPDATGGIEPEQPGVNPAGTTTGKVGPWLSEVRPNPGQGTA